VLQIALHEGKVVCEVELRGDWSKLMVWMDGLDVSAPSVCVTIGIIILRLLIFFVAGPPVQPKVAASIGRCVEPRRGGLPDKEVCIADDTIFLA